MTGRRLPRSSRGRALPRSGTDAVTWPPALRGRSPLLCLAVLGWLGGGVLATAVALMTESPNDLTYGLTNVVAAGIALLVLAAAGLRGRSRRTSPSVPLPGEPVAVPVPVPVPAQAAPEHDDRRAPALH